MEWLLILALAAWVFGLGRQQRTLIRRLQALEAWRRASEAAGAREASEAAATPPVEVVAPAQSPTLAASADQQLAAEVFQSETPVEPLAAPPLDAPAEQPVAAPPPARPSRPRISAAAWLSEHGLAWLGGGALALGGLFLAAYAAQRGVFTPALRIVLTIALGLGMVGVSEVLRRRLSEQRRGPAAALLAGAGAATLYGAVWAADRLYGFIDLPLSAPLLTLISAGLLGLAFLHGMPLALVALFGAYLAPVATNGPDWGDAPLTAYLLLILVTGHGVAALRGWKEVAWGASAGAVLWAGANLADGAGAHAAILLAASPLAALAAGLWRARRGTAALPHALTGALVASAVVGLALWRPDAAPDQADRALAAAAAFWVVIVLTASAGVGWRLAARLAQPAVHLMAGLGLLLVATIWPADIVNAAAAVILALVAAGALAAWRAQDDRAGLYASVAPATAALSLTLISLFLPPDHFAISWAGPAVASVLVAAAAAWLGRRSPAPQTDLGLAVWTWSAAVLAARAIFAGLVPEWAAPAIAMIALVCAGLHARLGWRGFGAAAAAAALASLYGLARVGFLAVDEAISVVAMSLAFALATAATWGASRLGRTKDVNLADGLSTGAWIMGLIGVFLLIRLRGGEPQFGLDPLLKAGLVVLLLLAAGLVSARGSGLAGPIGRWRQHLFLLAGLAYGAVALLMIWNPFWNAAARPIKGPPIVDGLALAYLGPALLLGLAVQRWVAARRELASLYAAGATLFGLAWAALELRRLFKGPGFAWGPETIGRAEGAAYVLLVAVAAFALAAAGARARRRPSVELVAEDLSVGAKGFEWAALALGAAVFGWAASPWWGPIGRPFDDHPSVWLLLALYAAGVGAWLALARRPGILGPAARVAAALQVFLLVTLAVRYGFRGLDMHTAAAEARVETWAFSAIWAVYGLAVLAFGASRRDMALRWTGLGLLLFTTAKVFLFDMARLDGMIRAASFLAVGALLIVAALAARRFGGRGRAEEDAPT